MHNKCLQNMHRTFIKITTYFKFCLTFLCLIILCNPELLQGDYSLSTVKCICMRMEFNENQRYDRRMFNTHFPCLCTLKYYPHLYTTHIIHIYTQYILFASMHDTQHPQLYIARSIHIYVWHIVSTSMNSTILSTSTDSTTYLHTIHLPQLCTAHILHISTQDMKNNNRRIHLW